MFHSSKPEDRYITIDALYFLLHKSGQRSRLYGCAHHKIHTACTSWQRSLPKGHINHRLVSFREGGLFYVIHNAHNFQPDRSPILVAGNADAFSNGEGILEKLARKTFIDDHLSFIFNILLLGDMPTLEQFDLHCLEVSGIDDRLGYEAPWSRIFTSLYLK